MGKGWDNGTTSTYFRSKGLIAGMAEFKQWLASQGTPPTLRNFIGKIPNDITVGEDTLFMRFDDSFIQIEPEEHGVNFRHNVKLCKISEQDFDVQAFIDKLFKLPKNPYIRSIIKNKCKFTGTDVTVYIFDNTYGICIEDTDPAIRYVRLAQRTDN